MLGELAGLTNHRKQSSLFFGLLIMEICGYRYCFGAPFVCDELAKDTCAAGAFAHPAALEDHHIRGVKSKLNSHLPHITVKICLFFLSLLKMCRASISLLLRDRSHVPGRVPKEDCRHAHRG